MNELLSFILANGNIFIIIAAIFAFFMAWGIGANDVANAMGTSVGTKTITIKQAIIIAMIFEFCGAYFAGGEVVSTIQDGIISKDFPIPPADLVIGMISSLLAAGVWLIVASYFSWPVSTTHTIVGAIVGFGAVTCGMKAINWGMFSGIVGSWIITPLLAGIIAFLLFMHIQRYIFCRFHPLRHAKRIAPFYVFLTILVITVVTIQKGLKHVDIILTTSEGWMLSIIIAAICAVISWVILKYKKFEKTSEAKKHYGNVEKVFSILMLITACAMAFAHGSNDVANAIGPLACITNVIQSGGNISKEMGIAPWILPLGGIAMVIGLATFGYKVMSTLGSGITSLTPSRGFAAQLATASTVVLASGTGLPISTTQTLVGAIMGVGLARGIAAINLTMVRNIVISWVITLPVGAVLAIIFFITFKYILHLFI